MIGKKETVNGAVTVDLNLDLSHHLGLGLIRFLMHHLIVTRTLIDLDQGRGRGQTHASDVIECRAEVVEGEEETAEAGVEAEVEVEVTIEVAVEVAHLVETIEERLEVVD